MYNIIKNIIPERIKGLLKLFLDIIYWCYNYRKFPFIIENEIGLKYVIYPWEKRTITVLKKTHDLDKEYLATSKLLKPGDTVIDIGANIGAYSLFCSRLVGKKGQVIALELIPSTYKSLSENILLNSASNIFPINKGAGRTNEEKTINILSPDLHAHNSLGLTADTDDVAEVSITTIDSLTDQEELGRIQLMKIDVEGFEDEVLLGAAESLLNNKITHIQFEISKKPLEEAGKKSSDIFNILANFKYQVYKFNDVSKKFEGPIESEDSDFDNYYASKLDLRKI